MCGSLSQVPCASVPVISLKLIWSSTCRPRDTRSTEEGATASSKHFSKACWSTRCWECRSPLRRWPFHFQFQSTCGHHHLFYATGRRFSMKRSCLPPTSYHRHCSFWQCARRRAFVVVGAGHRQLHAWWFPLLNLLPQHVLVFVFLCETDGSSKQDHISNNGKTITSVFWRTIKNCCKAKASILLFIAE